MIMMNAETIIRIMDLLDKPILSQLEIDSIPRIGKQIEENKEVYSLFCGSEMINKHFFIYDWEAEGKVEILTRYSSSIQFKIIDKELKQQIHMIWKETCAWE